MPVPLDFEHTNLCYRAMIGVGGIGAGSFFALEGNRTLGREESRGGRFLDRKDYCKLHIVSHYVSTLTSADFTTLAIGKVGMDDVGNRLIEEMRAGGIDLRWVERSSEDSTLFSFCFSYPDGSGGNLTTNDSASSRVTAADVMQAEAEFRKQAGRGIAVALPEVPMEARRALLQLGTDCGSFRVASFTSEEITAAQDSGLLEMLDLIALNQDETAALVGHPDKQAAPLEIAEKAATLLSKVHPQLRFAMTAGMKGSWSWDGERLQPIPPIPVNLVNGAGAGDAYLAGTLVGLAANLCLQEAQQLGNLVAALSVTSPHTIHFGIDRISLAAFVEENALQLGHRLRQLLKIN